MTKGPQQTDTTQEKLWNSNAIATALTTEATRTPIVGPRDNQIPEHSEEGLLAVSTALQGPSKKSAQKTVKEIYLAPPVKPLEQLQ